MSDVHTPETKQSGAKDKWQDIQEVPQMYKSVSAAPMCKSTLSMSVNRKKNGGLVYLESVKEQSERKARHEKLRMSLNKYKGRLRQLDE